MISALFMFSSSDFHLSNSAAAFVSGVGVVLSMMLTSTRRLDGQACWFALTKGSRSTKIRGSVVFIILTPLQCEFFGRSETSIF